MTKLERLGHTIWVLIRNYWVSEERWSAWALLVANIGLTLGAVYINVLINTANGTLFTALQKLDGAGFYRAFGIIRCGGGPKANGKAIAFQGIGDERNGFGRLSQRHSQNTCRSRVKRARVSRLLRL